eukprot:g3650.t1
MSSAEGGGSAFNSPVWGSQKGSQDDGAGPAAMDGGGIISVGGEDSAPPAMPRARSAAAPGRCSMCKKCCDFVGFSGRVVLGAVLGMLFGIILRYSGVSGQTLNKVLAFPGTLWVNALSLTILPLMFSNMATAVYELKSVPGSVKLARGTIIYYGVTTLFAAAEGLLVTSMILVPSMAGANFTAALPEAFDDAQEAKTSTLNTDRNVWDQIEGIFFGMVPKNIVEAAAKSNLLGIIIFGIVFGLLLQKPKDGRKHPVLVQVLMEINAVIFRLITIIITFTPFAIFSLICSLVVPKCPLPGAAADAAAAAAAAATDAAATSTTGNATTNVTNTYAHALGAAAVGTCSHIDAFSYMQYLGVLLGTIFAGLALHCVVVYPTIYFVATRKNPFAYMRGVLPAVVTALSTSSSAATLPVTIKCAVETNEVPIETAKFVLTLGATVNMDGTAIGFPCAVTFLAMANGITFSFGQMILVALVTTLASMGAAPIPSSGISLLLLIMDTVGVPMNATFGLIVAVDWLYDRPETATNIIGDSFAAGILSSVVRTPGKRRTRSGRAVSLVEYAADTEAEAMQAVGDVRSAEPSDMSVGNL